MKERWIEWNEKFLELTPREKIIIAFATVFLLTYLAMIALVEPALDNNKNDKAKLQTAAGQLANTRDQIADIRTALSKDPNEALKQQIEQMRDEYAELEEELEDATEDYVAPEHMSQELTSLLSTSTQVRVIGLTTLPPEVIQAEVEDSKADINASFFRHQFEVTLEGQYFPLMNFVQKVVAKNKEFSVNDLEYQVTEYPNAHMTLTLVTISDSENVIRL